MNTKCSENIIYIKKRFDKNDKIVKNIFIVNWKNEADKYAKEIHFNSLV